MTLSWNASTDPTVAGYKIYYGTASGVYSGSVDAGNTTSATITGLADGSTNYFAGTTYDANGNESAYSSEIVYVAPGTAVTTPATNSALNPVTGVSVTPNPAISNSVVVSWSPTTDTVMAGYLVSYGLAGASPTVVPAWQQTSLVVTGLVAGVTNYFAVQEYDVLWNMGPMSSFIPYCIPSASGGTSTLTNTNTSPVVTNTSPVITNTAPVITNTPPTTNTSTTAPVTNTPPTLQLLPAILLNIDSPTQAVYLTDIAPGSARQGQAVTITATSSKTSLISKPVLSYQNPNTTGTLFFKAKAGQTGSATITVTVNDGGASNNIVTRSLVVTVINFADLPKITYNPTNTVTLPGKNIELKVAASGKSLKYQWKHNGENLPGATSDKLNLKKVIGSDTGAYSVEVSNSLGITNSLPAVLTVVTNPAAVFSNPVNANGHFSFQVSGVPGGVYVVQATTDLQHWSSVQTNVAPFTFNDTTASASNQKFYRSYYIEPK